MSSKKEIVEKIKILIHRQFENPQEAFEYFDKDADGALDRGEIKDLLKEAKINRFLAPLVSDKIIEALDESDDEALAWDEFEGVLDKLT